MLTARATDTSTYCSTYQAKCIETTDTFERGSKGKEIFFVFRADGSGCIGRSAEYMDCRKITDKKYLLTTTMWIISCTNESGSKSCIASNGSSVKISVDERNGWRIGIGHNNYSGSSVNISQGKQTVTFKVDNGWFPQKDFAQIFQLLTNKKTRGVEWGEETMVEHGPKWRPSGGSFDMLSDVFDYLQWAIENKSMLPRVTESDASSSVASAFKILDCYSLRLGQDIPTSIGKLGAVTNVEDDFVDSAGLRGVNLVWQNHDAICTARFRAVDGLVRISIYDTRLLVKAAPRR